MEQPDIKGYVPISDLKASIVNHNKDLEKELLDRVDRLIADGDADPRAAAIAKTQLQTGFMWLNRAILQPTQ